MIKTKIVCTLGPATDSEEILTAIIREGLSVARFNFSHGIHEEHLRRANMVKKIRSSLGVPLALLMDIKGPDIRIGRFAQSPFELQSGGQFTLTGRDIVGNQEMVSISYAGLASELKTGARILIDDGLIELIAETIQENDIQCRVIVGGEISNNKSLNIPGARLNLPFISPVDKKNIEFAIANDFDYIAASFTRTAHDINELRQLLDQMGGNAIRIVAKIENQEGVDNIADIIRVSDGVMVARGDMGVEVPFEELPHIQKLIISECNHSGKPVITATQMLDSMIRNPRPTRAEITDVANAVYDGTSAIMLSGETSIGKYPLESVKTMVRIATETEKHMHHFESTTSHAPTRKDLTQAISNATCEAAQTLGAAAIITVTQSGYSARMISKYKPHAPIIALTGSEKVYHQLALVRGVYPLRAAMKITTDEIFNQAISETLASGIVSSGDLVVITGGMINDISGTTNVLKIHIIGDIIATGEGNSEKTASGPLCVLGNEDDINYFSAGSVLVFRQTTDQIAKLIRNATAVITEEEAQDSKAMAIGTAIGIPVISGIKNALELFTSGAIVTVDAQAGIIYAGRK